MTVPLGDFIRRVALHFPVCTIRGLIPRDLDSDEMLICTEIDIAEIIVIYEDQNHGLWVGVALYVGADLNRMKSDSEKFRETGSFFFTNLKTDEGLDHVISWIERDCMLEDLWERMPEVSGSPLKNEGTGLLP